jgi:hypothetical protein
MPLELTFKLDALHEAIVTDIGKIPYLADITVLREDVQDLQSEIESALGTVTEKRQKIGIFVLVLTPRAQCQHPNAPGPILDPLTITLLVAEDTVINRLGESGTKKTALSLVEALCRHLHRHVLPASDCALTVTGNPFAIQPNELGLLQYNVNLQTKLALKQETIT